MNNNCADRDLLAIEPGIFTGGGFDSQRIASGNDGTTNGTTFTSASADFTAAGAQAGMVLCVYETVPAEGVCYEIVSVNSPTELTVSVLRSDRNGPVVAPPAGNAQKYHITTFIPQIASVQSDLEERLRRMGEASGIDAGEFVDSPQLRKVVALGALAGIFAARASNASNADANWVKAEFYRRAHQEASSALRLARDADGDGFAEQTRALGDVTLRRV